VPNREKLCTWTANRMAGHDSNGSAQFQFCHGMGGQTSVLPPVVHICQSEPPVTALGAARACEESAFHFFAAFGSDFSSTRAQETASTSVRPVRTGARWRTLAVNRGVYVTPVEKRQAPVEACAVRTGKGRQHRVAAAHLVCVAHREANLI